MTSVQRLISNLDNRVVDAGITADDVAPAEHAAFPEPLEREGLGDIEISGAYTGAEDATLEIEITSDTAGSDRRTTAPEFTGVGNGSLEGLTASGAAAQSYTVSLIDTGTDTEAAEFPIEGVKLVAATAGIVGNLLELQVDASALTYTPTGATTVDSADAGSDTFASDAWSLGGFPLIAGRLEPATPRVAFGDDPTIYRPYRERRDGRWIYRLTPALENAVPKGAQIYVVTGSRVVTLTDGTDNEVYTGVVTAWDLLGQIQAGSDLAVIDGTASNDRTPGGMASRELGLVTRARVTRVEPTGTRYVTELDGLAPAEGAASQTVRVECTSADSVGRERWAVVGTADGDIGTAVTGALFESDALDFTIPKKIPLGGDGLRFEHIATRYADPDPNKQAPICLDEMYTGTEARDRTLTLTYTQRPGSGCECDTAEYTGEVSANLLGLDSLQDSGTAQGDATSTFDRAPFDAQYQATLDDLKAATPGATVYTVTHKAIVDAGREAINAGNQWEVKATSADGAWLLAEDQAGGALEVYEWNGTSYGLTETIARDIAEAGSSASVVFKEVAIVGGEPRVIAQVTGGTTPGLYRLDRSTGTWTATSLGINPTITNTTVLVLAAAGAFFQINGTLYNADGTVHSTLPAQPTDAEYGPMSADAIYFVANDNDPAGNDTLTIYSRSVTTYTSEYSDSSQATFAPEQARFSADGSRIAYPAGGSLQVVDRSGATWTAYQTLAATGPSFEISGDGLTIFEYDANAASGLWAALRDGGASFTTYDDGAFNDYQVDARGVFITTDGARFIANDQDRDTIQGLGAGAADIYLDSGTSFTTTEFTQAGNNGPLIGDFDRAANAGTIYERGWIAEFTELSSAQDWRDDYRALGTAEADGAKWRARVDLVAPYAEDLDPNDIGLTTSEPYYIGTETGGDWLPTLYDTQQDALDAITALADTTIQETGRTDAYDRAQPIVDYKAAYEPYDDYISVLAEIHGFLADVVRVPELEDEFLAAWNPAIADKDAVIAETLDGRSPSIRDRYADEITAFEAERATYGVAWEDTGADFWWVFSQETNSRGYLPAFTNVVYHSAVRDNGGFPYSTQEFAFVIKVACTNKLQEGDQIILNLDTGDAAYVVGDHWEVDIVAGASGSFYGGVDGDNTLTWDVRGSSSGALGTYAVEDGNETAYSANGLEFTIYRGQIPFSAGDRFTFSVEGGAWRWRFDDDDWAEETGFPDAATTLANGLSARCVAGSAPSFVAGDQYRWAIEQPAAPSHVADSFEDCWTFSAADSAWTATWGEAVDVSVVIVARHTLPVGSTLTVTGTASAEAQFSEERTVGTEPVVIVLDTTAGIDALTVQSSADGGSIGWIFAGDPPGIGGDAEVSMRPAWAMIRSGLNGAVARGRQDNAELRWDYLTAEEAEHLAAIFDHSKSAGDQPLAYVPSLASDQPKLRLVRFSSDDLALPDLYAWTDDDPVLRDVTVSLAGILL